MPYVRFVSSPISDRLFIDDEEIVVVAVASENLRHSHDIEWDLGQVLRFLGDAVRVLYFPMVLVVL